MFETHTHTRIYPPPISKAAAVGPVSLGACRQKSSIHRSTLLWPWNVLNTHIWNVRVIHVHIDFRKSCLNESSYPVYRIGLSSRKKKKQFFAFHFLFPLFRLTFNSISRMNLINYACFCFIYDNNLSRASIRVKF